MTGSGCTVGWSAGFDLPADLPDGIDPGTLVSLMGRDKKAHHDLTFVLDGPRRRRAGARRGRGRGSWLPWPTWAAIMSETAS